ncbi:programmed cell death 1 ligand 1-like isoform X1 [Protopterus annectens]|uniref:programmed cell death 1 ligand 1-like isoform X1 n=1 Tax=Protopterus annectens TaxID=7888 RepID=UPI001CFBA957|nr:programmed cell death 1 ligand 1-like isoform X1 [Protopterus annectens]
MNGLRFSLTFALYWCSVTALFTVEMTRSSYVAEHNTVATLECKFPIDKKYGIQDLKIFWHKIVNSSLELEVFKFFNGSEDFLMQDVIYKGRARLRQALLGNGRAVLEINPVKVTDTGVYRCLIELHGADYKQGTLEVKASYRNIEKHVTMIGSVNGKQQLELFCHSNGFPKAEVLWNSGTQNLSAQAKTSFKRDPEDLYLMTSFIRVIPSYNDTYSCIFMSNNLRESISNFTYLDWQIPDSVDGYRLIYVGAAIAIIIVVMIVVTIILIWRKRKDWSLLHTGIFQGKKKLPCEYRCKSNCTECWTTLRHLFRSTTHIASHTVLNKEKSDTACHHHNQGKQLEASQLNKLLEEDSQTRVPVQSSRTTVSVHCEKEP